MRRRIALATLPLVIAVSGGLLPGGSVAQAGGEWCCFSPVVEPGQPPFPSPVIPRPNDHAYSASPTGIEHSSAGLAKSPKR